MSYKVLYVDDDQQLHTLFRAMFNMTEYQLFIAGDGETGLEIAAAEKPDIILMDINMPEMNGVEVVRQLKGTPDLADIPVIAITADDSRENRERCYAAGVANMVFKPVSRFTLLDTVRKYIDARKGAAPGSPTSTLPSQPTNDGRKKVLVVDDNEDLRTIFGRVFDKHHFDVYAAADGYIAIDYMKETHPDVVILDINMPGISGFDVLNFIRGDEHLKNAKVIVVTGNTMAPNDPQAEMADLLLLKPVDIAELFGFAKRMMVS